VLTGGERSDIGENGVAGASRSFTKLCPEALFFFLQPAEHGAQLRLEFLADLWVLLDYVPNIWRRSYETYSLLCESRALFLIERL
jgi:hypothetical protein